MKKFGIIAAVWSGLNKLQPLIRFVVVVGGLIFLGWKFYLRNDVTVRTWTKYVDGEPVKVGRMRELRLKIPKIFGVGRFNRAGLMILRPIKGGSRLP